MQSRIRMAFLVAATGFAVLPLSSAVADEEVQPQTRQDLAAVMQSEALATMKYTAFAEHARKEGKTALAELLEQTAKAEHRHFMEAARMYGLVREDWRNLSDAIVSEYADLSKTYVGIADRAEAAGDKEVARTLREMATEEVKHHEDFKAAVSKSLKADD